VCYMSRLSHIPELIAIIVSQTRLPFFRTYQEGVVYRFK